jgi:hypothetical protein
MTAAQGAIARTEIEKAKGFAVVSFTNRAAEGVSKRATESSPIVGPFGSGPRRVSRHVDRCGNRSLAEQTSEEGQRGGSEERHLGQRQPRSDDESEDSPFPLGD